MTWPQVVLGDVVRFARSGISPETIEAGTTYVGLEHIDSEGNFIGVRAVNSGELASTKFTFSERNVLFGKLRPYLKKTARPDFSGICSTDILPLEPGEKVNRDYLFHVLRRQQFVDEVTSLCAGANLPRISPKVLAALKVPLPPIFEQRRIAAILDKADALRAKRREAIAKLDQLLRSVFFDMFGDHVRERQNWPVMSLGKALSQAEVFTDGDWVESKDQDPNGDVRLIQLADVGDGFYVDKSRRFLTREKALKLRCTFLQRNDILVARMPDPLGRACIFPGDSRESVTVVDVCVIRPGEAGPNRRWLCSCLNSDEVRSQIARMATGTTRSRISRGNLSKVELALPPFSLQEHFDQIAEVIERQKRALQRGADKLDPLFASLQHRAFTGTL